jgi:hypothetical protein
VIGAGCSRLTTLRLQGAALHPSDELSWKDAQQDPLSDALYLEVLDFERFDDGIVPIQPSLTIAVPAIPLDVVEEELSQEDLDALFDISQKRRSARCCRL